MRNKHKTLIRMELPSVEYLRECFDYADGHLLWKCRPDHHFPGRSQRLIKSWNTRLSGRRAGYTTDHGYLCVCVDGQKLPKHVHWRPQYGTFVVRMRANGKTYRFGTYQTVEEADEVAIAARARLHGQFACDDVRSA